MKVNQELNRAVSENKHKRNKPENRAWTSINKQGESWRWSDIYQFPISAKLADYIPKLLVEFELTFGGIAFDLISSLSIVCHNDFMAS